MTGRKGKIPYPHLQYLHHHHHHYYYHKFSAHLYLLATIPVKYNKTNNNNNNENADSGGKSDTAHIMSSHVRHLSLLKIGKCTGISTRKTHTHTFIYTKTNKQQRRTVCVSVQRSELSNKTKRIGGGNKQVCRCKQSQSSCDVSASEELLCKTCTDFCAEKAPIL